MERGSHPRIQPEKRLYVILSFTAKWRGYREHLGEIYNFTGRGAFIRTARLVLPGQKVPIQFLLDNKKTLEVKAVVRHLKPGRGAGFEFLDMNGTGIRFLCKYWRDKPPRGAG